MKNKIVLFLFFFTSFTFSQKNENPKYVIGIIPEKDSFFVLNEEEKKINKDFKTKKTTDFETNRSRIYLDKYYNEKNQTIADDIDFLPLYCNCSIKKDSVLIQSTWNYYGISGFEIKMDKNKYQSKLIIGSELNEMQFQNLILDNQPSFKEGQQLTGLLTFVSKKRRFPKEGKKGFDEQYYKGKAYFICQTKVKEWFTKYN
jgi:hypothetical protein